MFTLFNYCYMFCFSVKARGTPISMEFSQSMPTQKSRISSNDSFTADPRVTVDKIQEQKPVSVVAFFNL